METMNPLAEQWAIDLENMRFLFLTNVIFVNSFVVLSEERRKIWKEWLEKMYPSKRVVML